MVPAAYITPLAGIGLLLLAVGLLFSFGPVILGLAIALIVIPLGAALMGMRGGGNSESAEKARRREPGGKRWWEKSPYE